jgi:hypothetical protein
MGNNNHLGGISNNKWAYSTTVDDLGNPAAFLSFVGTLGMEYLGVQFQWTKWLYCLYGGYIMLYPNLIQLIVTYYVLLQWWKTPRK